MNDYIYHHSFFFFYHIHVGTLVLQQKDKRIAAEDLAQKNIPDWKKRSHLDTISLTEGKHLRHSSQHTGLQRSEVMMTNEWPRSPKRPKEEPLESFSRGTGDIFTSPEATTIKAVDCKLFLHMTQPVALRLLWNKYYVLSAQGLKVKEDKNSSDFNHVFFCTFPFFLIIVATVV